MSSITAFLAELWKQPTIEMQQTLLIDVLSLSAQSVGFTSEKSAGGALFETSDGIWGLYSAGNPFVKKLKALAPYEGNAEWWVVLMKIPGLDIKAGNFNAVAGSIRSLADHELNMLKVHLRAHQNTVRLNVDSLMVQARQAKELNPNWSLGRCVFNQLPSFITAQIIDTELNMHDVSDEPVVLKRLSAVVNKFDVA